MMTQKQEETYKRYFDVGFNNLREENKPLVLEFDKKLVLRGVGIRRRLRVLRCFAIFERFFNKPVKAINKEDIEHFLLFLQKSDYAGDTKSTYWEILRMLSRFLKIELGEEINPHFKKKVLSSSEILTPEEAERIILHAGGYTQRICLSFLWESGCRIGELLNMKASDIQFDGDGAVIALEGKTGRRRIRIVKYAHELKVFISEKKLEDDKFVFQNAEDAIRKWIRTAAKDANVSKDVYPHIFRHSRATYLAKYLREQELKYYMGWTGNSKMAGTYVHLSGADLDSSIIELNKTAQPSHDISQNQSVHHSVQQNVIVQPQGNALTFVMPTEFMQIIGEMFLKWKDMQQNKTDVQAEKH